MNTALFRGVSFLSKCFTASGYFWLYTLKGLIVYGVLPAACMLTAVLADLKQEGDVDVALASKGYYRKYQGVQSSSLVLSLIFVCLFSGLYWFSYHEGGNSLFFLIIVLYLLGLTLVITVYLTHFIVFGEMQLKQALAFSFVYCIKKWQYSLLLLASISSLYLISRDNLIVCIFILPFLLALSSRWILEKARLPLQDPFS